MNSEKYAVIWKHFDEESALGKRLKATTDFSLPYFLTEEEKTSFDKKEEVSLNPFHMVMGLLVGYFDKPPGVDTKFAREKAPAIIKEHLTSFKTNSMENLLLDLSNFLRDSHGQKVSLQSLIAGVELVPDSSAIKYDACIDLINCIDDDELDDRIAAVQQLKMLLSKIDAKKLNQDLVQDYMKMIEIANEF
ncbi:hypothetical protein MATR_29060 [Marivirga tractuosa]|uniref:Uncharacterized protein n=1 Tax=Marivirga tractuosa (strain ATCC 23168 / DSM 4126 / NBRC 15989 / NCIMB 1408 / VKM B-1430 / H-43) TaxID=643867 RepID=E4TW27_MARTH|nr:hypothetical protein [Marivirga tractuosa]ADR23245.1 hypothetical protein Ftrac_3271 [Marivirga tractuosa DSM 4126]BDD16081.1 hypothetical protein MATR_29060 [Marivirga tractuosa]